MSAQKITFNQLSISYLNKDDNAVYFFKGDIDETFKYERLPLITGKKIIFDLNELGSLNSCAIREWIMLVNHFTKQSSIEYHNCPVMFIDQINMVPELKNRCTIASFFAPYYCEQHGEELNKLIGPNEINGILKNHTAPDFKCEKCGKPLEFDALEESYFSFIDEDLAQAG